MITSDNKYVQMQLNAYNNMASEWSIDYREPVVGSYDAHNEWKDYELLFEGLRNNQDKIALDFACGPGRNIVKYSSLFKRIDGVDISPINIENAKKNIAHNNIELPNLYVNNGVDLSQIPTENYDLVISTIALQHICVYDIRKNIFNEIYRVLKIGGIFSAQMGYGSPSPSTVGYYENYYDAIETNGECDVCVENADQIKQDLDSIGFKKFSYKITQVGPGDSHPNWIFFNVQK
jgi:ubiquinone/menaquinone biosynthesis C-methylase UbiE